MAKKAKYKNKTKPKKYDSGALDLVKTGLQKAQSDTTQDDGSQGSDAMGSMMSKFQGAGNKFNAIGGGATAIFNNLADASKMNTAGNIQSKADAAGDSHDNPFKEGEGGRAMLKGGLAGAEAGAKIAGPLGAAVGGALGVGSGIVKGIANQKAHKSYEKYNNERLKEKGLARQQAAEDPYENLRYMKGTKYKSKPNQKLDEKSRSKANIEFEGGEPIFSPKKADGTRDLLHFDKNGPKHSEGGIPAKVVAKNQYKKKEIQKPESGPVEVPEGSAIITAKKNMGSTAVLAHKLGRHDVVEKIINKMPEDKPGKKDNGTKYTMNPKTGKMETKTRKASETAEEKKAREQKAADAKVSRTAKTDSTIESDNKKNYQYTLKNLSKADADAYNSHRKSFEDHQKVLSAYRQKAGGRDLNEKDQQSAFDAHNKLNGTNLSVNDYRNSLNGIDDIAKKQGVDINLRGDIEGKGNGTDQAGIFGKRNDAARFGYEESPAETPAPAATPAAAPENKAVDSKIPLKGPMSTAADKPANYKMRPGGVGVRASDVNNMYRGLEKPEVEHYDRIPTNNQSYYDLSDPARRASMQAAKAQVSNAVNLSGGSAGNARANMNAAYADNANRQQGINAFELGRFGEIKNANAQNKQNVAAQNTGISNEEKNVNAANRQATKDQFQTGLVGMDENNYRNRITNDQYNVDMQKNDIENKKLNLLKNGYSRNYDFDNDYNVAYKKKGAKNLKYKTRKKS